MKQQNIGKAIKTKKGYRFIKAFYQQGTIYKYMGDLNSIGNHYPIYSSEYQDNGYETKATLKKLCKHSKIDWRLLFNLLDWAHAETTFLELSENIETFL